MPLGLCWFHFGCCDKTRGKRFILFHSQRHLVCHGREDVSAGAQAGPSCRQVSQRQRENWRYGEAIKPQARSVPSDMLPLSRLWLLKLPQASQSAPLPGTTRTVKNISHPSHSAIFSLNPEQELAEAGAPVVQPLHPAMVTEGFSSALTMVTNSPTFLSVTQN